MEAAEKQVAENERFVILNQCMQRLKPEAQTLLTLRYLNKKRFAEIAEILGVKEGTLRMRNKRALEKLRIQLEKQGAEDESIGRSPVKHTQTECEGDKLSAETAPESA
jgi:DNA-directed RNA polymerase specialized sigma24 family protein